METIQNMWTVVEKVRVASGAAELAIFTAIIYWFFTSSRIADMLEVLGERVGSWCGGRDGPSLRQSVRPRRRHNDIYAKLDAEYTARSATLYRIKEGPVVPAPQPITRPPAGLACAKCAPISRESWQDPKGAETGAVINVMNIGKQSLANGGVVSRYLCDLTHCTNLLNYDYEDVVPKVVNDNSFQSAIEETTRKEVDRALQESGSGDGEGAYATLYKTTRQKVEVRALKVLSNISSAMSNGVLKFVAWLCHKGIRRLAKGGCATRIACVDRLRRAKAAGLPLIFVPLHRSHLDYILVTFALYLTGLRPPLVAAGENMSIPLFGWFLRGCGAFYIRRRVDGSNKHGDPVYKAALRSYILHSLTAKNNLEFFIEGGRTRTGKPQPPKAGILSVIMDAYLDGTIDDALLVPVALNYDKLVDGNFVREQLGMPKQMETFWSALRGIWWTLNTDHGTIRVDFNQPISLKELVTSFKKYNYLKAPIERPLAANNNSLGVNLDHRILYNNSHSSLFGADVSTEHKIMVEAIGRHLVYDAAQASALMCTNVVAYVLMSEQRTGCTLPQLHASVHARGRQLARAGRDLGYTGDATHVTAHALEMLGRGLIRKEGSGDKTVIKPQLSIAASIELSYYANTVGTHYAANAIMATALESILQSPDADQDIVRHSDLLEAGLQLSEVLSQELILCPPCVTVSERLTDAIDALIADDVLAKIEVNPGLEEERWSRRFAQQLEEDFDEERPDPTLHIKYRINWHPAALAERRRLLLTVRPLLEAYAATARCVRDSQHSALVKETLDSLAEDFSQGRLPYGEAVSTDAIRNCHRLLRQWGVLEMVDEDKRRSIRLCAPYDNEQSLQSICSNIYKFNMKTDLLDIK
ncbi:unnamed protein product [Chilo suppressalis]|uniref:Phospholipid/glycerol acyltransferase domain-containing protein n=2 Tax=Chilo suppressalis TaxID=168631 RepID=A0ABN8AZ16_CHISP|nr:unnamed protein product [Chilo suppressalis]